MPSSFIKTIQNFDWKQDNLIIATAIPYITTQFNSLDDVGWYGAGKSAGSILILRFELTSNSVPDYHRWLSIVMGQVLCAIPY